MGMFKRATKTQSRLRMAITGPPKAGKTFSSLSIATALGRRIALIDTEHGAAAKYGHKFDFDVVNLDRFAPQLYTKLIQEAEAEGYDVLIIDSLSHAWMGRGGALEMHDIATKKSRSGNSYIAWSEVTPHHNTLIDTILQSNCHIIATMRSKTEYVLQPNMNTGKSEPKKVGLGPIQREGMEFEFDVLAEMDIDHNLSIVGSRCETVEGLFIHKPGPKLGETLMAWLSDGVVIDERRLAVEDRMMPDRPILAPAAHDGAGNGRAASTSLSPDPPEEGKNQSANPPNTGYPYTHDEPSLPGSSNPDQHGRIMALVSTIGMSHDNFRRMLARREAQTVPDLSAVDAQDIIRKLQDAYDQANLDQPMMESIQAAPSRPDDGPPFEMTAGDNPTIEDATSDDRPAADNQSPADDHVIADVTRKEKTPAKGRTSKACKSKEDRPLVDQPIGEPAVAAPTT